MHKRVWFFFYFVVNMLASMAEYIHLTLRASNFIFRHVYFGFHIWRKRFYNTNPYKECSIKVWNWNWNGDFNLHTTVYFCNWMWHFCGCEWKNNTREMYPHVWAKLKDSTEVQKERIPIILRTFRLMNNAV